MKIDPEILEDEVAREVNFWKRSYHAATKLLKEAEEVIKSLNVEVHALKSAQPKVEEQDIIRAIENTFSAAVIEIIDCQNSAELHRLIENLAEKTVNGLVVREKS